MIMMSLFSERTMLILMIMLTRDIKQYIQKNITIFNRKELKEGAKYAKVKYLNSNLCDLCLIP
jgi:hypothetical protein